MEEVKLSGCYFLCQQKKVTKETGRRVLRSPGIAATSARAGSTTADDYFLKGIVRRVACYSSLLPQRKPVVLGAAAIAN